MELLRVLRLILIGAVIGVTLVYLIDLLPTPLDGIAFVALILLFGGWCVYALWDLRREERRYRELLAHWYQRHL